MFALLTKIKISEFTWNRMLSDVYFSLAVAHIYNSSPDSDPEPDSTAVDPVAEKQAALKYYNLSREVSIIATYIHQ